MAASAAASSAARPPASTPRDPITQLQIELSDLCALYVSTLGNVQNEADKILHKQNATADEIEPMTTDYASQIVRAHREIERLASELEGAYRPEAEQMRVLADLQARHAAVTSELRAETAAAEAVQARLSENLDSLLDGIISINASHPNAASA